MATADSTARLASVRGKPDLLPLQAHQPRFAHLVDTATYRSPDPIQEHDEQHRKDTERDDMPQTSVVVRAAAAARAVEDIKIAEHGC